LLDLAALCTLAGTLMVVTSMSVHANSLTAQQRQTAAALASSIAWKGPVGKTLTVFSSGQRAHPLGLQTLSIERQEQKNRPLRASAEAQVRVYQYHYHTASSRVLVFSLANEQLLSQHSIPSVHLPLNSSEINFAAQLLTQHGNIIKDLQNEQSQRGQPAFVQLSDLDVKASIFEPLNSNHPCATERCALLSLFDHTRTVFATEPVVFLQSRQVKLLNQP